jgi:cell division protein ZipA
MDPDLVRLILIILGVLLVVGIYLWDRYKHARPRNAVRKRRRPARTATHDAPAAPARPTEPLRTDATTLREDVDAAELDPEPRDLGDWSEAAGDPQFTMDLGFDADSRADYLHSDPALRDEVEPLIVVMHLIGKGGPISGPALARAAVHQGLEPGEMSIYHRHDPAAGGVLFSVASMVEPGVFPFDDMSGFETPGLALFTQLPGVRDGLEIYAQMLQTAQGLAAELGAELQDERRNKLTRQMQEHTRETITEHRRRIQLARSRH